MKAYKVVIAIEDVGGDVLRSAVVTRGMSRVYRPGEDTEFGVAPGMAFATADDAWRFVRNNTLSRHQVWVADVDLHPLNGVRNELLDLWWINEHSNWWEEWWATEESGIVDTMPIPQGTLLCSRIRLLEEVAAWT